MAPPYREAQIGVKLADFCGFIGGRLREWRNCTFDPGMNPRALFWGFAYKFSGFFQ
jgi:hypothetical protein